MVSTAIERRSALADPSALVATGDAPRERTVVVGGSRAFWMAKRTFDVGFALFLLPSLIVACVVIGLLNTRWNPGPLFFVQPRMGRHGRRFSLIKFRSMRPPTARARRHDEPMEIDRVTPLGYWLRRTRMDELPQVLNVLAGQMSFLGPRPDVWEHACVYADIVPGYRARHAIRPGISGLAQVRMGYAEGVDDTHRKTRKDLVYIRHVGWVLEAAIIARTLQIIFTGHGAR